MEGRHGEAIQTQLNRHAKRSTDAREALGAKREAVDPAGETL